jgi:hypothetical protein
MLRSNLVSAGPTQFVTVTCPQCGSKGSIPAGTQGDLQCRKCAKIFSVDQKPPPELSEDESDLAPALPPPSGVPTVYKPAAQESVAVHTDLSPHARAIAATLKPVEPDKPPDYIVIPPRSAGPAWAFTNNVATFPWTLISLPRWLAASAVLAVTGYLGLVTWSLLSSLRDNSVFGPPLMVLTILVGLLSLSYVVACMLDISVNAAYNADKLGDWPYEGFLDRLFLLVRVIWYAAFAAVPAAVIGALVYFAGAPFWAGFAPTAIFTFPFTFLSGMEADSPFWPVSLPIWHSLRQTPVSWFAFYLVSSLLLSACCFVMRWIFGNLGEGSVLILGPMWAAAVFIYGRLLGRLAWLVMKYSDPAERKQLRKRFARQSEALFRGLPD